VVTVEEDVKNRGREDCEVYDEYAVIESIVFQLG
jgi:hypothetical protein